MTQRKKFKDFLKNHLQFKNLIVIFFITFLVFFVPLLIIELTGIGSDSCKKTIKEVSQKIPSGGARSVEFVYSGNQKCKVMISTRSLKPDLSLWVYRPGEEVQNYSASDFEGPVILYGYEKGKYRVSIHNNSKNSSEISLLISALAK